MFAINAAANASPVFKMSQPVCSARQTSTTSLLPFLARFIVASTYFGPVKAQVAITNPPKHVLLVLILIIQHNTAKPVRLVARFAAVLQIVPNAHLRIHTILTFATLLVQTQLLTQSTQHVLCAILLIARLVSIPLTAQLARPTIFSLLRMAHLAAFLLVLLVTSTIAHYFHASLRPPAKAIQLLWQAL